MLGMKKYPKDYVKAFSCRSTARAVRAGTS